jgi:hypothetical protein
MTHTSHMYYYRITQKSKKDFSPFSFHNAPGAIGKSRDFLSPQKTRQIITARVQLVSKNGIMFASHSPS